jgi:hypothetical protein
LTPSADTYSDSWNKDKAFGSNDQLLTYAAFRKALLRFDLSSVPPSTSILSAKLSLTFKKIGSDLQLNPKRFYVYDVGPEFSEAEATYNQWSSGHAWGAPGLGEFKDYHLLPYRPKPFLVADPGRYTVDITNLATMAIGAGSRSLGLTVFAPEFNTAGTIASRESADAGQRPTLTIEYSATAPQARAAYVIKPDGSIDLDGSASALPNGTKTGLSYLWTIDRPSYGSGYHAGDTAGNSATLTFRPDAPGYYVLRLKVGNAAGETGETTIGVTSGAGPHPRLHLNADLLEQMRSLKHSGDPVWTRFYNWVKGKPTYSGIEGGQITSYLLAYLLTGDTQYFDWSWTLIASQIYQNKTDRAGGMVSLADIYKGDNHNTAFMGGPLEAQVALMYDWGYDRLTSVEKTDLIAWMNDASEYNYLRNASARSFFRNDGAAATYGIAAAAYATLGENPEADKLLAWYRDNWDEIRQALDIMGTGGSLTEGNAYGTAPTASNLIRTANLVYYASGEDLFSSHPWFRQRLMYDAFATYPGTVGGPGSPVPDGWPGVMLEQSSLGGDGRRGSSFHSINLRPNGLILARRFAGTSEAATWNWVFRQSGVDQTVSPANSFLDLLYHSPLPRLTKPAALSYYASGTGYVYIRSDWNSPNATWIALWAGPHLDTHQHLDQGAFAIFKRRDLAPKTGCMDLDKLNSPHSLAYYTRTISSNGLLVGNPSEIFQNFVSGMGCDANGKGAGVTAPDNSGTFCIPNDGGQRTMSPFGLAAVDADTFTTYRDVFETAKIVSFEDTGFAVTLGADLTNAYNNPRYSTPGNTPKVRRVYRRMAYLRPLDVIVLGDTIESTDPGFEKKWLLHSLDQLQAGGSTLTVDAGETVHTGVNEAKIVVDDSDRSDKNQTTFDMRKGYAALLLRTLLPNPVAYRVVGGRDPADTAHPDVYSPDSYNLNRTHLHRHIKDFWVRDFSESRIPNHRSFDWMPESPPEVAASPYDSIFGPGYGRWRLEIEPSVARTADHFLNVLKPVLDGSAVLPATQLVETADTFAVRITANGATYVVTFSKSEPAAPRVETADSISRSATLPGMPGTRR